MIESHTDPRGSSAYNRAVSQARADGLKGALVKEGVPEGRLEAVGEGRAGGVVQKLIPGATRSSCPEETGRTADRCLGCAR